MFTAHPESVALLRWCQQTVSAARSGRVLAAFCLCALLLAIQIGSAVAQDAVGAKGQLFDDFGRLTLDWAKATPPEVDISLSEREMVLRFNRPLSVDPAAIRANLKAYIRNAALSADGMTLALALKKPVTYRLDRSGARVQLDLAQPGEAVFPNKGTVTAAAQPAAQVSDAVPAQPGAPAAAPPAAPIAVPAPSSGPNLKLRSGEHSGYSRLAIDWPGVGFSVQRRGDKAIVSFSMPGRLDTATRLPPRLRSATATSTADGALTLELQLLPNVGLNAFRNGNTVVIDLVDGKAVAEAAPPPVPAPAAAPAPEPASPVVEIPPTAEAAPAEVPPVAPPPAEAAPIAPALQSEPPVALEEAAPTTSPPVEIAPPVVVTKEPAVTPTAQPPAPVEIIASATPADNGAVLALTFPKTTGLAAFRRGDALWLVFDRPGPVDLAALIRAAPVLTGLARVDNPYATVLRLPALETLGGGSMGAKITGDGRQWQISLGRGRDLRPAKGIEQRRESLANGGASLLLQATRPGQVVTLRDPEAGDEISAVPLVVPGMGIADGAAWPDFRVLPSFQGVVVVPISDRTRVEALPNGVVVTTDGEPGAPPSPVAPQPYVEMEPTPLGPGEGAPPSVVAAAPEPASPEGAPQPVVEQSLTKAEPVVGIFDLPRWRKGGEANFASDEAALRAAIDDASNRDKPLARLALAQFHFAHGRYPETLDDMALLDKQASDGDKDVLALRGAARALAGRDAEARTDFERTELNGVPEADLFRGFMAARALDWPVAAKIFTAPIPSLDDYPKPARMLIRRAAAEALLRSGNSITAQAFLDSIRLDMPSVEDSAYYDYLTGLQLAQAGNKEEAIKAWSALADSPVDEVHARSQFDLTELQLAEGKIDARQAASQLEALRFVWRGTDFEFDLLDRLGGLYVAADQPRKGLVTLRQAATNFPKHPRAKNATEAMSQAFYDLYLGDKADRLAPLTAVALYDEFRELTPSGADGDRMLTSLADRLVKVDLLDGAARLLENQVNKRLTGLDKAKAGTRLAAIRLLDGNPDLALEAIKASEVPDIPPDVTAQRRRLQGRALFETGDTLKGMALVRDDNSLDGLWLKADLSWRMREWPAAAAALGNLIDGEAARLQEEDPSLRPPPDLSVDPAAALAETADDGASAAKRDETFNMVLAPLILNQAIALSLANDRPGLRMLGKARGAQMAKGPYATAFATLTSPSSSLEDSITAAMKSVDQLGAFVDDYRDRLKKQSLSAPETAPDAAPPAEAPPTP